MFLPLWPNPAPSQLPHGVAEGGAVDEGDLPTAHSFAGVLGDEAQDTVYTCPAFVPDFVPPLPPQMQTAPAGPSPTAVLGPHRTAPRPVESGSLPSDQPVLPTIEPQDAVSSDLHGIGTRKPPPQTQGAEQPLPIRATAPTARPNSETVVAQTMLLETPPPEQQPPLAPLDNAGPVNSQGGDGSKDKPAKRTGPAPRETAPLLTAKLARTAQTTDPQAFPILPGNPATDPIGPEVESPTGTSAETAFRLQLQDVSAQKGGGLEKTTRSAPLQQEMTISAKASVVVFRAKEVTSTTPTEGAAAEALPMQMPPTNGLTVAPPEGPVPSPKAAALPLPGPAAQILDSEVSAAEPAVPLTAVDLREMAESKPLLPRSTTEMQTVPLRQDTPIPAIQRHEAQLAPPDQPVNGAISSVTIWSAPPSSVANDGPLMAKHEEETDDPISQMGMSAILAPRHGIQAPVHDAATPTVPQQLAQAVASPAAQSGPIELVLSPEDLGRLRFDLQPDGDRVHVVLSAERPETMDLLRRHAPELVAELKASGYSDATLSFSQWGAGNGRQHLAQASFIDGGTASPAAITTLSPNSSPQAVRNGSLDLRF